MTRPSETPRTDPRVEVIEKAPVDAERERMLDMIRDLWLHAVQSLQGSELPRDLSDRAQALLDANGYADEHGRLSGEEGA